MIRQRWSSREPGFSIIDVPHGIYDVRIFISAVYFFMFVKEPWITNMKQLWDISCIRWEKRTRFSMRFIIHSLALLYVVLSLIMLFSRQFCGSFLAGLLDVEKNSLYVLSRSTRKVIKKMLSLPRATLYFEAPVENIAKNFVTWE